MGRDSAKLQAYTMCKILRHKTTYICAKGMVSYFLIF